MAVVKTLLFAGLGPLARAQTTHTVSWQAPYSPMTLTANAGDTINFVWTSNHNVYRMSDAVCTGQSFGCDFTGATLLSDISNGPYAHSVLEADKGKNICISCQVGAHCTGGQKLYLTVPNNAATSAATTQAATSGAASWSVSVGVLLTTAIANLLVFGLAVN